MIIDPQILLDHSIDYLAFIRSQDCAVKSHECLGGIVPAHLETVGMGRDRKKPSLIHFSAVPLCNLHHIQQEGRTARFNEKYNIDLWRYAFQLTFEFLTGVEACWRK